MKTIDEELSLEKLIEEGKNCKDIEGAKKLLFTICGKDFILEKAVQSCIDYHEGQFRKSGEPYAVHPILVASLVAFFSGNKSTILVALLHDVIEDTNCTEEELKAEFGSEVLKLVLGLTKIIEIREDNLNYPKSKQSLAKSALTFRNMLLASIEDVRVLVVKLCDRLHNMLTLEALREDKQRRISEETLVVYVPIAHRLGISSIKNYLEDLSFKYLMPDEYKQIYNYINSNDQQMQLGLNDFISKVELLLLKNGFRQGTFQIQKRIKHSYSIYLKMQRKGIGIEEVLDLLGIRILVEKVSDCYLALGILHTNFNPLVSRFKDYIALPKQNGYQTIHATLFDTKNIIEAQIRTFDMHKIAEFGIAAHWKYKEDGSITAPRLDWLTDISMRSANNLENTEDYNAIELYEYAKDSLYVEDIAVYSPKGEIFTLPRGATVLDFAYEIHTKIGLHAKSAYVNRVKVPLLTQLKNGDIVRVVTAEDKFYRCSWIDSVKTGKAKASIREFCKQKIREINFYSAFNMLHFIFNVEKERIEEWVEKENLGKRIRKVANDSTYFKDIVNGLKKYAKKSYWFDKYEIKEQKIGNFTLYSNHKITNVDFDYCCHPKRGDSVVAFVEAQNAIVHHKLCNKAEKMIEKNKDMVFIKWNLDSIKSYKLIFSLENKKGILAEFLVLLAKMQINLLNINLSRDLSSVVDYFEIAIEIPDNINPDTVRERLKTRCRILDFMSLDDAYKEG
ncbi:bifunctional (p)ppGpp synthetase/guanosine-3',5'-bis(diphosphate) 3'-pyrophosphohydrolase [Campylobacter sp. MIT 21-1685]|uniref:RelA/SpoT family protein n=1 Tax=unclassified Campylobacter TaxID=2593542 RepID=UPI00224B25F2|nr:MULTISPECIES: bifunctional (p)ppGpp synthetase/guanosine-3',5'-bis(diphosphate) 3'-pyrophosphohydrolase [unclassified Campylobacter]MCX2682465.1 bifunctional (p)ppGpp synthetase/guanosine-3',5'-bis(diphosphate) 3'-pyrophosphohydrolase [Campylobacter sp. MIT 21-1684]MCX2750822.1 bifunctional (p)ppGpp synthetase/guanosine-3',5'-bis(diphosphate) 3'-pyrophosphohydrolase [Campylobacter sp. MIT 21-1682]MCX2806946.1 bifunctional (p)ppGpp synthetase/guanosine-3',5'-bis(diphosphate) 3'-pyrophosphohydr